MSLTRIFIISFFCLTPRLLAASPVQEDAARGVFSEAKPEHVGMDEAKLVEARDYALRGGGSGCILRRGRTVMTWGDQRCRYDIYSSTKSIAVAALGLAVMDGKVKLHDKARQHLVGVASPRTPMHTRAGLTS